MYVFSVIPDALQHIVLQCWSGIVLGIFLPCRNDPVSAKQHFVLHRARDDDGG
jgi:hypothetical protein